MKWLVILLTCLLLVTGCQLKDRIESVYDGDSNQAQDPNASDDEAVPAKLMTIQRTNISSEKSYPASIEGRQSVKIIPRIDGYLQRIRIKEGEHVKSGQTLFEMDQATYKAEINVAKANVDAAKAEVANAQLNLDSKRKLREKNIISEFELRQAEINLKLVEAQLEQSQAQLNVAQTNLSYTTLKSPSNGVVGRLPYHVGDYVGPSITDGLTTIADTSEMTIYFSLTEREVVERIAREASMDKMIAAFPAVKLRLSNLAEYSEKGRVESISGIVDSQTGALQIRAVFPNPDGILLSGGTGSIVVPENYENVIVIPQEATYEILDKVYVYKIVDGRAKSTIIHAIPMSDGQHFVVKDGLEDGDTIIAKGAGYIQEDIMIIPMDEPELENEAEPHGEENQEEVEP